MWCEGKCERRKFTLTLTLTTETPINRAFQANCEGVRVEKEKSFFILEVDELTRRLDFDFFFLIYILIFVSF